MSLPRRITEWWGGIDTKARLILAITAAVFVLMAVVSLSGGGGGGGSNPGGIPKAQYDQWRRECEARATATLDTSRYQVGGNHWVDEVNACLTAKAND